MQTLQVIFWILLILTALGAFVEPAPGSPYAIHASRATKVVFCILFGILAWCEFHGVK